MWGLGLAPADFDRLGDGAAVVAAARDNGLARVWLDTGDALVRVTIVRQFDGRLRAYIREDVAATDVLDAEALGAWLRGPAPRVVLAGQWVLAAVAALRRGAPLPTCEALVTAAERVEGGVALRWAGGGCALLAGLSFGREWGLRDGLLDGAQLGHPRQSPVWVALLHRIAEGRP
jgi:hypothetical protein